MRFSWAHPTSFTEPVVELANGVHLLRRGPLPVLSVEFGDPGDQQGIAAAHRDGSGRAIDIRDGVVLNPSILRFQRRGDPYPPTRMNG